LIFLKLRNNKKMERLKTKGKEMLKMKKYNKKYHENKKRN
jgi:hypothetical protein